MDGVAPPRARLRTFNYWGEYVRSRIQGRLLDHQIEALEALQDWFMKTPDEIALTAMPTGSGKTGVICCLPYFLGASQDFPFRKPVLVIAPNLQIASQLEGQTLPSKHNRDANFLCSRELLGRNLVEDEITDALPNGVKIEETKELSTNPKYLTQKDVIIANAQKFLSGKWETALPDDLFQMVIVDEAHHFPAPTWLRIIDKFKNHALVAFFTATPFRTDEKLVVECKPAYRLPLEEARARGIIRRTVLDEINDNAEVRVGDLSEVYKSVLRKVWEKQEKKKTTQPLPNDTPHMAMAIAKDTAEADEVEDLWNTLFGDETAIAYHYQLPTKERLKRMQRLKDNKVRLVVVVDMLKEGFDHPPISIAAILTNISSPVKFTQFIGRAQRIVRTPEENERNVCADIVTHVYFKKQRGNYHNFQKEWLIETRADVVSV